MTLDPQARSLLDLIAQLNLPPLPTLTAAAARELSAARVSALPPGPDAIVHNRTLPTTVGAIGARVYRPRGSEGEVLPAVVCFHGGGFVIGSLDQNDGDCRRIAAGVGCAVVNVDYGLAPEHKFPQPLEQAYAATRFVAEHAVELGVDPARIAVLGDSAGGNLAACVAILARDRGGPAIAHQVLIYPVTDLANFDTASYLAHAEGLYLTRETMQWFASHYLPSAEHALNGLASPLRNRDLSRLPPALVVTAEYDPLCDEGEAYAERLRAAGVATRLSRYPGMIHGFFTLSPYLDAGKRASAEVVATLRASI